ncbi:hypothetical protein BDK51DRAFT_48374, partial [Blyttiomyces helicus]
MPWRKTHSRVSPQPDSPSTGDVESSSSSATPPTDRIRTVLAGVDVRLSTTQEMGDLSRAAMMLGSVASFRGDHHDILQRKGSFAPPATEPSFVSESFTAAVDSLTGKGKEGGRRRWYLLMTFIFDDSGLETAYELWLWNRCVIRWLTLLAACLGIGRNGQAFWLRGIELLGLLSIFLYAQFFIFEALRSKSNDPDYDNLAELTDPYDWWTDGMFLVFGNVVPWALVNAAYFFTPQDRMAHVSQYLSSAFLSCITVVNL